MFWLQLSLMHSTLLWRCIKRPTVERDMLAGHRYLEINMRHNPRLDKELLHKSNPSPVMISIPSLQVANHLAYYVYEGASHQPRQLEGLDHTP